MVKIKIDIDYSRCVAPQNCMVCINVCQPVVLTLTFLDKDYHNPKDWKIVPIFPSLCINCNSCVEHCPEKAISVVLR